jgi:hypothetical protein
VKKKGKFLEIDEAESSTQETEAVTPAVEETTPSVSEEEKKAEPVKAKTEAKAKKEPVKTSPTPAGNMPTWDAPEWVKALYKPKSDNNGQAQEDKGFATKYLMPTASNTRRRPGGSMKMFLDMARETNKG